MELFQNKWTTIYCILLFRKKVSVCSSETELWISLSVLSNVNRLDNPWDDFYLWLIQSSELTFRVFNVFWLLSTNSTTDVNISVRHVFRCFIGSKPHVLWLSQEISPVSFEARLTMLFSDKPFLLWELSKPTFLFESPWRWVIFCLSECSVAHCTVVLPGQSKRGTFNILTSS